MDDSVLGPRNKREDLDRLAPVERPDGYEPVLVNRAPELAVLYAAVALLYDVSKGGGTALSPAQISAVRERLESSIPNDVIAILRDELAAIGEWLDDRIPDEWVNPDVSHIRSSGDDRWHAIVRYAIENGFDLRGEYYEPESETWPVVFGSPLFYDDVSAVLERRDGVFVTILFRDTRWLMPVTQRAKPELADVLPFRPGTDAEE